MPLFSRPERRSLWAIALLLIGISIPTCQRSPSEREVTVPQPAVIQDGLRVGVLLPRTGSYAIYGKPMLQVFPLLMHRVNACGGVNAAPVTFIAKDDRADPSMASRWMAELSMVHRVQVVIGGINSPVSLSLVDSLPRLQVPILSPASTSLLIPERVEDHGMEGYWARTVPSDGEEAATLAGLAIAQEIESVAIVVVNDDYGTRFAEAFTAAFEAAGGTAVNGENLIRIDGRSPEAIDPAITEVLDVAEALLLIAYPNSGGRWLRDLTGQDLLGDRQLLLTSSVYTPRFLDALGLTVEERTQIEGALGLAPGASGRGYIPFRTLWEEQEGYPPPAFVAQTWDAGVLVLLAAEAAGRNSSRGIVASLPQVANPPGTEVSDVCRALELLRQGEAINYQGASGPVDLDPLGNVIGSYDVWSVNDQGQFNVLYQIQP
jgi:neutral amino acid transport system substrate-binding protein